MPGSSGRGFYSQIFHDEHFGIAWFGKRQLFEFSRQSGAYALPAIGGPYAEEMELWKGKEGTGIVAAEEPEYLLSPVLGSSFRDKKIAVPAFFA